MLYVRHESSCRGDHFTGLGSRGLKGRLENTVSLLYGSSPTKVKINFKRLNGRFLSEGKEAPVLEGR